MKFPNPYAGCCGTPKVHQRGFLYAIPPFGPDPLPLCGANECRNTLMFTFLQYFLPSINFTLLVNGNPITSRHFPPYGTDNSTIVLRRKDYGTLVGGEFSFTGENTVGLMQTEIIGQWCDSDFSCPCSMYSSKTVQVTGAAINYVQALGNNPMRLSMIISSVSTDELLLSTGPGPFIGGNPFYDIKGPLSLPMTYRDFGPLVTGELWVYSNPPGSVFRVTEIFAIPKG